MSELDSLTHPDDMLSADVPTCAAQPVCVRRLSLQYFRNYSWLDMRLEAAPVVLTGANGAGKTNILEALSLLAPGRGLRGASLAEMQSYVLDKDLLPPCGGADETKPEAPVESWGGVQDDRLPPHGFPESSSGSPAPPRGGSKELSGWQVAARLHKAGQDEVQLGTGRMVQEESDSRVIHIDGQEHKGQQRLAEHVTVLWLTPPMEHLFIGPAAERRKFFDRLVYGFTPSHASAVNRFEQAMRERNKLLQFGRSDPHWLAAIERKMAEYALAIAVARVECAEKLNGALQVSEGAFPTGWLDIEGRVEALLQDHSALEAEQRYVEMLELARPEDARAGRTLIGPHRSDLQVEYADKKQPAKQCSTGEQKALMLSLMLAVARARRAWRHSAPILLLDEVVAHLDPDRRLQLFDAIDALGMQAWMTGVEAASFGGLQGKAQFWRVEEGKVTV